jgi:hypothetical protein
MVAWWSGVIESSPIEVGIVSLGRPVETLALDATAATEADATGAAFGPEGVLEQPAATTASRAIRATESMMVAPFVVRPPRRVNVGVSNGSTSGGTDRPQFARGFRIDGPFEHLAASTCVRGGWHVVHAPTAFLRQVRRMLLVSRRVVPRAHIVGGKAGNVVATRLRLARGQELRAERRSREETEAANGFTPVDGVLHGAML